MGIRAHLQKGRTKAGLVLPADAQAKLNQAADRSTLEKWLGDDAPGAPNVVRTPADTSKATLRGGPRTAPETHQSLQENVADRTGQSQEGQVGQSTGPDDLQLMEGVGAAYEQRLYDAGYTTYEALAEADPTELAEKVDGISEDSAKGVIKQAKKLAKKKAAGKL